MTFVSRLSIHEVEILWRRKNDVFITNDISPGARIVTSRIPTPIPDMLLRTEVPGKNELQDDHIENVAEAEDMKETDR